MKPLVLYFNELSAPPIAITHAQSMEWRQCAAVLFACLRKVARHQPQITIAFPSGCWHAVLGEKPLSAWLQEWLERSQYQWLLSKVRNIDSLPLEITDVYFGETKAIGLTMSFVAGAWSCSFPVSNSSWLSHSIDAIQYRLEGNDVVQSMCTVRHLSNDLHVAYWEDSLHEWGRILAENNTVGDHHGYLLQMYPLDHAPPHIHLIDPVILASDRRPRTLAKYRIDRFERMEGEAQWDNQVRSWIERNRDDLLLSWERCIRGKHPFRVA